MPVLRICHILVRIQICGSLPLTNGSDSGSGFGSCYFRQSRLQLKFIFVLGYYYLKLHLHHFSKINVINKSRFFLLFLLDNRRIRSRSRIRSQTSYYWIRIRIQEGEALWAQAPYMNDIKSTFLLVCSETCFRESLICQIIFYIRVSII
jgi:hypothetical protein